MKVLQSNIETKESKKARKNKKKEIILTTDDIIKTITQLNKN